MIRVPLSSVPITREGEDELRLEITLLEEFRQQIVAERGRTLPPTVADALDQELAAVDEQIAHLRGVLALGEPVVNTGLVVGIGSQVSLEAEYGNVTLTIAGPVAATPRRGYISFDSPLGRALLGAELGDWVEVPWEGTHRKLRVLGIQRGQTDSGRRPGSTG